MSNSKSFDAKGNCSNKIGDHCDVQNHGLVNNQIFIQYPSNQSPDGTSTFPLNTLANGVPLPAMNNQLETLILPKSDIINVESTSLNAAPKNVSKRKANMKEKEHAKMADECQRLKKAITSLENENVFRKNQHAWMRKSFKRHKKIVAYLKDKYIRLTGMATGLAMVLMESNNSENEIQLHERIRALEASNAQLLARNAQLQNERNAREVNKENDHELDQAKN